MPPLPTTALIIFGIALLAAFLYWQLVIAEGAYLGQRIVTWLYDITAKRYDDIKQYDDDMETNFLGRPLAEAFNGQPAPLVLDVAAGTGRLPVTLFNEPTFMGRVIGIDASRPMLEIAVKRTQASHERVRLLWRSAAYLPFPDGVFDAVTCLEMLEFTPNPEAQLEEAVRVLRPGGMLVTTRRRGWNAAAMPGKTHSPEAFGWLLEEVGVTNYRIIPWQVEYDLVYGVKDGISEPSAPRLLDVLVCPACGAMQWDESADALRCQHCDTRYRIRNSIIEMNRKRPRRELVEKARRAKIAR